MLHLYILCCVLLWQWRAGDFIISDNLAVAHWAPPDTQLPPTLVDLRVMHRTIVKGTTRPTSA